MSQKTFNKIANIMFWVAVAGAGVYAIAEPIHRNGLSHLKGLL